MKRKEPVRADLLMVEQQLAQSRSQAQRLIAAGHVEVDSGVGASNLWRPVDKAAEKFSSAHRLRLCAGVDVQFVSRGGHKLQAALQSFAIDPQGLVVLDVGQSTGGFTGCLLQAGAAQVIGVDVGREQLTAQLRADPRVTCFEGLNARELSPECLAPYSAGGFALIVMDVSFISQTLILPRLAGLLAPKGRLVSLVKPQFEVGRAGIGKGGIVRDASLYAEVEAKLRQHCQSLGLEVQGYRESPITGTDGNREFLMSVINPRA